MLLRAARADAATGLLDVRRLDDMLSRIKGRIVHKALDHVYGYALGLDMTRRDLQNAMGAEKKPWEIGKSFDHSAVLGPIHPVSKTGHFTKGAIRWP